MKILNQFYIDGTWVDATDRPTIEVINPATEASCAVLSLGQSSDVDDAVAAATEAFESFSQTSVADRKALLGKVITAYQVRMGDIAQAIHQEMGAPLWLAQKAHTGAGLMHLMTAMNALDDFEFTEERGTTLLKKEPIGVCGFITPWNWPMNQICCKLAPALATGCTVVWKPSEVSPLSANILMEILHDAGVPAGVVNMVHGDGPNVGAAIAAHEGIDMVSFTGSTNAGILVAQAAAASVKRVSQELGGKSANILMDDLDDAAFTAAVKGGVQSMMLNSGQNCNAPSRMLVPKAKLEQAMSIAASVASAVQVGGADDKMPIGPVVSKIQYDRIQALIETGESEAILVAGGAGRPEGMECGFYVRPTIFGDVDNQMNIARQEIFGPVLCILPYENLEDAVSIANDTVYGLSGYISGGDKQEVLKLASRLRTGMVHLNGASGDFNAPFGGFKRSGNGREWGKDGFEEYLETKSILGGVF